VLDKTESSAFESTLNSPIVSYRSGDKSQRREATAERFACRKEGRIGAWSGGRFDMWFSRITDKYQKRSISGGEMYSKIRVEWAVEHFGLGLT